MCHKLHCVDVHSLKVARVLGMPVLVPVAIVRMLFRVCDAELVCRKDCDCGTRCDREKNDPVHFRLKQAVSAFEWGGARRWCVVPRGGQSDER